MIPAPGVHRIVEQAARNVNLSTEKGSSKTGLYEGHLAEAFQRSRGAIRQCAAVPDEGTEDGDDAPPAQAKKKPKTTRAGKQKKRAASADAAKDVKEEDDDAFDFSFGIGGALPLGGAATSKSRRSASSPGASTRGGSAGASASGPGSSKKKVSTSSFIASAQKAFYTSNANRFWSLICFCLTYIIMIITHCEL